MPTSMTQEKIDGFKQRYLHLNDEEFEAFIRIMSLHVSDRTANDIKLLSNLRSVNRRAISKLRREAINNINIDLPDNFFPDLCDTQRLSRELNKMITIEQQIYMKWLLTFVKDGIKAVIFAQIKSDEDFDIYKQTLIDVIENINVLNIEVTSSDEDGDENSIDT